MSLRSHKLVTAAVVSMVLLSVIALAGTSGAVQTSVVGPDELAQPHAGTFTSNIEIRDNERVPIESFTATIQSASNPDATVDITFAPDGTILEVNPERGAVGEGEIRVNLLERTTDIRLVSGSPDYGYDGLHGYDERTGDHADFGYGYGYGSDFTFEIDLDPRAFKHGEYELTLAVNTEDGESHFHSNTKSFTVLLPNERLPGSPDDTGPPNDRPGNGPDRDAQRGPPVGNSAPR